MTGLEIRAHQAEFSAVLGALQTFYLPLCFKPPFPHIAYKALMVQGMFQPFNESLYRSSLIMFKGQVLGRTRLQYSPFDP